MKFHERYGPWALVAGASEGVGASVTQLLGQRGVNVVLVGRRQAALDEVAATIATEIRNVVLDLTDPQAAEKLAHTTSDLEIGLVVYNAGAAGCLPPVRYLDKSVDHWHGIINRNCSTVVSLTHHFGSRMVQRGRGGIVLVGSTSGWAGTANMAIYGATKSFQLILAESLWAEFKPSGVDVLAMVLGPTDTPAFRRLVKDAATKEAADCNVIAREMLNGLPDGPTWPPGPSPLGTLSRREAVLRRDEMRQTVFSTNS